MRCAALLLFCSGLAMTLGVGTTPAEAALNVCNRSNLPAKVAVGRFNGTKWMSEGWWTIEPTKCATLVEGNLKARYYYLYATDGAAGTWDGGKNFCTTPNDKFAIVGRADCAKAGFDKRGFFEIDTGQSPNWTQSLQ